MCLKSMTRDQRLYFPSEGSHTQDFYALKKIHRPQQGLNPRTLDPVASMITTGVDNICLGLECDVIGEQVGMQFFKLVSNVVRGGIW